MERAVKDLESLQIEKEPLISSYNTQESFDEGVSSIEKHFALQSFWGDKEPAPTTENIRLWSERELLSEEPSNLLIVQVLCQDSSVMNLGHDLRRNR